MAIPKIFEVIAELKKDVISKRIDEDERVELENVAKESVMQTPLREVVECAENLGFETEFSPQFEFGSDIVWQDREGKALFNVRFIRPTYLNHELSKRMARFALHCMETEYHVTNFKEGEKARFYKWMAPLTWVGILNRGSLYIEDARTAVDYAKDIEPKLFRQMEETRGDKQKLVELAVERVIRSADVFEIYGLEFWMLRDGTTTGRWSDNTKGVSSYVPGAFVYPLHERIEITHYGKELPKDIMNMNPIYGEGRDLGDMLVCRLREVDEIFNRCRSEEDGYEFAPDFNFKINERYFPRLF